MTPPRFVLGVDIGQARDYTAMVVLERVDTELHARHVERLTLGMSYPDQVARMAALVASPQLSRDVLLTVDATGVGKPIVDLLRAALRPLGTPVVGVIISSGATATRVGSRWSVPKRDLIAAAQVALQTRRLKISSALPAAQILVEELTAYRITIGDNGHDSFGNSRETANDDLVLAIALATYVADRRVRRTQITHVGLDESLQRAMGETRRGEIGSGIFR